MTPIQELLIRARQEFDSAAAFGSFSTHKPVGIAIRMKSGAILAGHTQPSPATEGNAARHDLDSAIILFPSEGKVRRSIMDKFTIAAVAIVAPFNPKNVNVPVAVMATLQEYPEVAKGAQIYMASSKADRKYAPPILQAITLDNSLNT